MTDLKNRMLVPGTPGPELRPGDWVLTPTGRAAVVRRVDPTRHEADVQRIADHELLSLRVKHLRPAPDAGVLFLDLHEPDQGLAADPGEEAQP